MVIFYLDTSALLKRYRTEQGTDVVTELLVTPTPDDRLYISFLAVLEFTSGILRLVRGGQLAVSIADGILARFRQDVRDFSRIWPLNEEITNSAVAVVEEHRLRSGDAIHLATALAIGSVQPEVLFVLVSSDHELLDAAAAAGLTVLDPAEPRAFFQLSGIRAIGA